MKRLATYAMSALLALGAVACGDDDPVDIKKESERLQKDLKKEGVTVPEEGKKQLDDAQKQLEDAQEEIEKQR